MRVRPDYQRGYPRLGSYRITLVSPAGNDWAGRFRGYASKAVKGDTRLLETSVGLYPPAQLSAEVLSRHSFPAALACGSVGAREDVFIPPRPPSTKQYDLRFQIYDF